MSTSTAFAVTVLDSADVKVTIDNGNVDGGTPNPSAFHGDYIELAATFGGGVHTVRVAWRDNRDVPTAQCDLDLAAGPASNNIGNRNQNIYASTLTVTP